MQAKMQDLTQIDAVIFDLDGTLVHTLGDFQVALHRTMADLDLPPCRMRSSNRPSAKAPST